MHNNQGGFIVISMAILISLIVLGTVLYTIQRNAVVSKSITEKLTDAYGTNELKAHAKSIALTIRKQLAQGVDPATLNETLNLSSYDNKGDNSKDENGLSADRMVNVNFNCGEDDPDIKNKDHRTEDGFPPKFKKVYYTCKKTDTPAPGFIITAYMINVKKADKGDDKMFDDAIKTSLFVYKSVNVGTVEMVSGTVYKENQVVSPGGPQVVVIPNQKIDVADELTTAADGIVKVVMRDNTRIVLGGNSKFKFNKFDFIKIDKRETVYELIKGTFRALFDKVGDNDKVYITTKTAAMGIRGTEVVVDYDDDANPNEALTLMVIEGSVKMFQPLEAKTTGNIEISPVSIPFSQAGVFDEIIAGEIFQHFRNISKPNEQGMAVKSKIGIGLNEILQSILNTSSLATYVGPLVVGKIRETRVSALLWAYLNKANANGKDLPFSLIDQAGGWKNYLIKNHNAYTATVLMPIDAIYSDFNFAVNSPKSGFNNLVLLEVPDSFKDSVATSIYMTTIYTIGPPSGDTYLLIGEDPKSVSNNEILLDQYGVKSLNYHINKPQITNIEDLNYLIGGKTNKEILDSTLPMYKASDPVGSKSLKVNNIPDQSPIDVDDDPTPSLSPSPKSTSLCCPEFNYNSIDGLCHNASKKIVSPPNTSCAQVINFPIMPTTKLKEKPTTSDKCCPKGYSINNKDCSKCEKENIFKKIWDEISEWWDK